MDIGTGKDLSEYVMNEISIPYHLIDIINPSEDYSVYSFQKEFHRIYNDKTTLIKYNQEFLNDSLWKASSKDFDAKIVDPYDNKVISMKNMINKLLDYIKPSLIHFNNYESTIDTINDILQNGTECDLQLDEYSRFSDNTKSMENLKKYLMNNVDYSL